MNKTWEDGKESIGGLGSAMSRWRAPGDLQRSKDPWLIQNEVEKQGARAGRAGELLVCGLQTVTLRTRVGAWSLGSGTVSWRKGAMPASSQRATLQPGHELSQVRVCQTLVGWKQTHP